MRKAMGNEFKFRVKVRNYTMPSNRWHYEFFRTRIEAERYAAEQREKDCLVKVQGNTY